MESITIQVVLSQFDGGVPTPEQEMAGDADRNLKVSKTYSMRDSAPKIADRIVPILGEIEKFVTGRSSVGN